MEERERAETQRKHFRKTNQENILIPTHLQSHWVLARNFIDITLHIIETQLWKYLHIGNVSLHLYRNMIGRDFLDHKANFGQLVAIKSLERKCQFSRVNSLTQLKSGMC